MAARHGRGEHPHRRLRSERRARYETLIELLVERFGADEFDAGDVGDEAAEILNLDDLDVPPRWYRRGNYCELGNFLPDDDRYCDEGYPAAVLEAAFVSLCAWTATVAACAALPCDWGVPADEPAPAQPLDVLTPIEPHAPDALALVEEIAAA